MIKYLLVGAITVATFSGCASIPSDAPAYVRAPSAPMGFENVYIYRKGAYPTLRSPIIKINAKEVVSPPEGSYTVFPLKPGTYNVTVEWSWDTGWPNLNFPIEVKAGESYYLKLSGSFDHVEGMVYSEGSSAQHVETPAAEAEMAMCCRYIRPRSLP